MFVDFGKFSIEAKYIVSVETNNLYNKKGVRICYRKGKDITAQCLESGTVKAVTEKINKALAASKKGSK